MRPGSFWRPAAGAFVTRRDRRIWTSVCAPWRDAYAARPITWIYLLRLAGFMLLIVGIVAKNVHTGRKS
jgi:hypothetical protein